MANVLSRERYEIGSQKSVSFSYQSSCHHLSFSRGVPKARMTAFSVLELRQSVPDGPDYMTWSVTSIRIGLLIIRKIWTLSWCL